MTTLRLRARPRVTTVKVDTLLQWANKGLLRLPQFQRPLRWKPSDFVDLFDSVYRGFPVGTLLLAQQQLTLGTTRLGPFVTEEMVPTELGYFIIDGQQRITTLVGTLLHPDDEPLGDSYSMYFDLEDETFFVRSRRKSLIETAVPLRVLRNLATHLAWTRSWRLAPERPDLLERADQLAQSIREFEIAAAIVDGKEESTLREIFVRTNRAGVSLSAAEVFEALHATSPENSIAASAARLEALGAENIKGDFFLRCLLHVGQMDPGTPHRSIAVAGTNLVKDTETALARAIAFLRADCEVDEPSSMPQVFPLLPLAGFFNRFPNPSERARRLLRRWFWRGMVADEFSDNGFGAVRKWQKLQVGALDDVVASSMLETIAIWPGIGPLPPRWNKSDRWLWFLQVALSSQNRSRTDLSFDGSFLGGVHETGGWVPLTAAEALETAPPEELSKLGFDSDSQRLLRAYLAEPAPQAAQSLIEVRLNALDALTASFLESVCEPSLSGRPSIGTILDGARGAA
jgi:hypothetical protein